MFDSLAKMVSINEYERFARPHAQRIFAACQDAGVPTLYYVNGFAPLAVAIGRSGTDVYGLDWRTPIDQALHILGNDAVIMGNLEPYALFAPSAVTEARVQQVLTQAAPARAHIFNLGEGIMPETPVARAREMVDMVHRLSRR